MIVPDVPPPGTNPLQATMTVRTSEVRDGIPKIPPPGAVPSSSLSGAKCAPAPTTTFAA